MVIVTHYTFIVPSYTAMVICYSHDNLPTTKITCCSNTLNKDSKSPKASYLFVYYPKIFPFKSTPSIFPGSITKLFSTSSSSIPTKSGGGGGGKAGDIGGGITLLAMRPLNTEYSTDNTTSSSNGMLPQASTLSLDTGLRERGAGHSRGW